MIGKARMKGSYTVEAAIIVPLLLFLIVGFLYWNLDLWKQVINCCEKYAEWKTYVEPAQMLRLLKRANDLLGITGG